MSLVIHEQREAMVVDGGREGGDLWASPADLLRATGWDLKPEGLCRGEICIPLGAQRQQEMIRGGSDAGRTNISGLWRSLGHPVASDEAGDTWVLGTGPQARAEALRSLDAPDFTLPDLDGIEHALTHYRGKKVFLATWASW